MLLERAIQSHTQESIQSEQLVDGKDGVIQRVQKVLDVAPELISVYGHENDYLYLFNASTDLVLPELEYIIGFSVQITRTKEKGTKSESIHFYNSDLIPNGNAHFYRLDITSGPEVTTEYNRIKAFVEEHPEMPELKLMLNMFKIDENTGEIFSISDNWAETKLTAERINELLDNSIGYQLPERHSGLNLKDFREQTASQGNTDDEINLLSSL